MSLPPGTTVADVLDRMEKIEGQLGPDDGVRWFNRLYLEVTQRVAVYDESGPQAAPGFLAQLDVAFADLYFSALDAAGAGAPPDDFPYRAWKPLFDARGRRDVAPVQFALAGMNATSTTTSRSGSPRYASRALWSPEATHPSTRTTRR